MNKVFAAALMGIMMTGSTVFAHSAYYDCAVRSGGSVDDVARNCGLRSDFDRTGRVGPDNGYNRGGGWDHGRDNDNGFNRGGRRGGRWNLNSLESSVGSCYSEVNGQGEEMRNVSAEACTAMGGQSFFSSEM